MVSTAEGYHDSSDKLSSQEWVMARVQRTSLVDQAAEILLARIRAGEWPLGDRLPGETTLAPQLGVGRSTVREAIRQLAGHGVLDSRQGAGVFVTALDVPTDWAVEVRRADIVTVLEARIAIETEAAALAAERRTDADLEALRRGLDARRDRISADDAADAAAVVDADTAFHRAVVAAAGNPVLLQMFDGLTPRVRSAMIDLLRLRPGHLTEDDHDDHADLVTAIDRRDPSAAARCSRDHLRALAAALG